MTGFLDAWHKHVNGGYLQSNKLYKADVERGHPATKDNVEFFAVRCPNGPKMFMVETIRRKGSDRDSWYVYVPVTESPKVDETIEALKAYLGITEEETAS